MNPDKHREDTRLQDAIAKLFDGELDDRGFEQLSERLREDARARELYFHAASLETNLDHVFAPPLSRSGGGQSGQSAILRKQAKWAIGVATAAALLIASMLWIIETRQPRPGTVSLRVSENSQWSVQGPVDPSGATLQAGARILIEQGTAELQLPDKVRAVIEAPAALTIVDERTLQLDHGCGFFEVGSVEGQGFTVITPYQRFVDLGTAFGVDARNGRRRVKLHVFEGEVRVDNLNGTPGEVIGAERTVFLNGQQIEDEIEKTGSTFLRTLPPKVETVFREDFESGLAPEKDYAVLIEPRAVRDLAGNHFPGIEDNKAWNFSTGLAFAATVPVQNPGFEEDGEARNKGASVTHWHKQARGWGWGVDQQRNSLTPPEGKFFGRVFGGHMLHQVLDEPITAGTTYVLTADVGLPASGAVLRLFGSDGSPDTALAETTVSLDNEGWLRNQSLTYTATEKDATGQSLGIALTIARGAPASFAAFDRIRLAKSGYTDGRSLPPGFNSAPITPVTDLDPGDPEAPVKESDENTPPIITALHPPDGARQAIPDGTLTMAFSKPIKLGTGRIFLRNITDWTVTEIAVGGPHTSVDGRFLTITPPSDLADGERSMGRIPEWESKAWIGVFNPSGDGTCYSSADLNDTAPGRGELGSMRGPVIATFEQAGPGSWMRRRIGSISPETRYTVSAAIGIRSTSECRFDGYTIHLSSGDSILAELVQDLPPGPPSSAPTVAFSWNSAALPTGVQPGDPLTLTIAPNQASGKAPGYLDLDAVQVTASAN